MAKTLPADSPLLKQARDRFLLANEADAPQDERERDDISFEDGNQWPTDVLMARLGQQPTQGQPSMPARPTIVINKVRRAVQQVLNQERQSDIGIEIVPADDFGDLGITPDDTEVTLREGLTRRIQRESQAADARSWAFKRAAIAGRGYYLVMTRYLPGKTSDQEIYVHRIYNQAGVKLDPSHEQPDGSDADWGFVGTWVPWERIAALYPRLVDGKPSPFGAYDDSDFIAMTEAYPGWYRQSFTTVDKDGKTTTIPQQAVRVTDYWYTERETKTLVTMPDGQSLWEDEVGADIPEEATTRDVVLPHIKFCKIVGGCCIVEETDWEGSTLPIIKVLGEEILPYDEQRRAEGMVRQARGAAQGLNYMISKQVEMVGLTPIPPLMVDPEAIDGYEAQYQQMNTRTFGSLPYRTYDDQGRQLSPPTRPPVNPDNQGIAQSIGFFDQAVQDTTAVSDPAMGETDPSVKSARHARYLIEEARLGTSNYLDNLARSVRYEGQVINDLLYPIYGARPGRLVRILTGEGEAQMMRIDDPEQQQAAQQLQQKALKVGKLTKDAHFNVLVKVTKSSDSRRDQFVRMFGEILNADPNQMLVGGDLFYRNMDIPEAKQLAKRQRVMLAPPIQQMLAAEEQGQVHDPAAQAQIAELTQRLQLAEQAMQELAKDAEGKRLESDTKKQIAAFDADRDIKLETLKQQTERMKLALQNDQDIRDNATKIHIAEIQAKTQGVIQAAEAEHEAMALAHEQTHEAEQAGLDREALDRQEQQAQDHEVAMRGADSDIEGERASEQRDFEASENARNRQATADSSES